MKKFLIVFLIFQFITTQTLFAAECFLRSHVCVDGPSTKNINGFNVTRDCWQYNDAYVCNTGGNDNCTNYENNNNCTLTKSSCQVKETKTGLCINWNYSYSCKTADAVVQQQTICGDSLSNLNMPTPNNANQHFIQGALAQEILNEGGNYLHDGKYFTGVKEECTKGYGGLKNCCKSMGGAKTNAQMTEQIYGAAASTIKYLGEEAVDWASPYVFDYMYKNNIFKEGLVNSFNLADQSGTVPVLGTDLSEGGLSLGAYGFSVSTVETTGLFNANIALGASNGYQFYFNPYSFAAAVAMAYFMSLLECTDDEYLFMLHKGADLSDHIDTDCSKHILGACVEDTLTYCSFNSVLARVINIQGKRQLGLDVSDCQGITADQMSKIDFSNLDFSLFTQSIVKNAQDYQPSNANLKQGYETPLNNTNNGTGQNKYSPNSPAY